MRPVVLSIAGSDCSGGAGIQADLKAIEASGGYAATVVTSITAQNGHGVRRQVALDPRIVEEQLEAVFEDLPVAAAKSGVLAQAETIERVARLLRRFRPAHYVLDPVLAAESGAVLLPPSCVELLLEQLVPLATLVTPNVPEIEVLAGMRVLSLEDAERAGRRLLERGAHAVLVKGGHLASAPATDLLVTPSSTRTFREAFLPTPHARGTGCVYASAIATHLARGLALAPAIAESKQIVTAAIRHGLALGGGRGPSDPLHELHGARRAGPIRLGRLHVLTDEVRQSRHSHHDLARAAVLGGADTLQFREKRGLPTAALVARALELRELLAGSDVSLLVNDRVDVAVAAGAAGVHLGATDLAPVAARRLLGRGSLIGRTANTLEEALAVESEPVDYLGVGPVFGTTSKENPRAALGLEGLRRIVAAVGKPVIAIGGIDAERVPAVLASGAYGVAVLSAVVDRADPAAEVARIREAIRCSTAEGRDERRVETVG